MTGDSEEKGDSESSSKYQEKHANCFPQNIVQHKIELQEVYKVLPGRMGTKC